MYDSPIPRLVSAYFFCQKSPGDQLCASGVLDVKSTDFRSFAQHWSNFGLRQLAQAFVLQDDVLKSDLASDSCTSDNSRRCPGWFKIKEYFEKLLPTTGYREGEGQALGTQGLDDLGMYHVLRPVESMLGANYTAVGILEEWDTTMALYTKALQLPNWDWEAEFNEKGARNVNNDSRTEADQVLHQAWADPEVREIIWLDILLYDHAVAIFKRQVAEYAVG